MPICKYCGEQIEWRNTPQGWKAVDFGVFYYYDFEPGDTFVTLGGNIIDVTDDGNYPNLKGNFLHECTFTLDKIK